MPPELALLEDWTGADLERPKLERARERIRNSSLSALICYSVDRLARDPIHIGIVAEVWKVITQVLKDAEVVIQEIEERRDRTQVLDIEIVEELAVLRRQQTRFRQMEGLGERVREFCSRIGARADQFDFNEKRLALRALQIKVVVAKDGARLQGASPTNLATTEQTWA